VEFLNENLKIYDLFEKIRNTEMMKNYKKSKTTIFQILPVKRRAVFLTFTICLLLPKLALLEFLYEKTYNRYILEVTLLTCVM
jgi:hypothetical protein